MDMKNDIIKVLTYIQTNLTPDNLEQFYANYSQATNINTLSESDIVFTEPESHKYYEAAFQLDNHCKLCIGESYYTLHQHQFCIIPSDTTHALRRGEEDNSSADMLWISITGSTVRVSYSVYTEAGRSKLFGTDLHIPARFLLQEIQREKEENTPQARLAVTVYIKALVTMLLQHVSFDDSSMAKAWGGEVVEELQRYIAEHLSESVSLQQLSNHVSLSPNYLCKLFKQVTGETITNYTQSCKMEKALTYLKDDTLSLGAIAERLGFYDQFHFSKTFKTFTGMSPSVYRSHRLGDGKGEK